MYTRRNLFMLSTALVAVAACGTGAGQINVTPINGGPPTLAMVQQWGTIVVNELPVIESTLISQGKLTPAQKASFDTAIAEAQTALNAVNQLQPGAQNVTTIVQTFGNALSAAAAMIPASAPYAEYINIAVMIVTAFIAAVPPPAPVPPQPTPSDVHAAAVKGVHP